MEETNNQPLLQDQVGEQATQEGDIILRGGSNCSTMIDLALNLLAKVLVSDRAKVAPRIGLSNDICVYMNGNQLDRLHNLLNGTEGADVTVPVEFDPNAYQNMTFRSFVSAVPYGVSYSNLSWLNICTSLTKYNHIKRYYIAAFDMLLWVASSCLYGYLFSKPNVHDSYLHRDFLNLGYGILSGAVLLSMMTNLLNWNHMDCTSRLKDENYCRYLLGKYKIETRSCLVQKVIDWNERLDDAQRRADDFNTRNIPYNILNCLTCIYRVPGL